MRIVLSIFILLFILDEIAYAQNYYGTIQYTKPETMVTHLVFQEASPDKKFCLDLNKNYIRGLMTTCPTCEIELQGCSKKMDGPYRDIFKDKPIMFPYLSAPYTRIAVFGVPMKEAIAICKEMAVIWQRGMNQEARCIF